MANLKTTAMLCFASGLVMLALQLLNIDGTRNGFLIAAAVLSATGALLLTIMGLVEVARRVKLKEDAEQLHSELEAYLKSNDTAQ